MSHAIHLHGEVHPTSYHAMVLHGCVVADAGCRAAFLLSKEHPYIVQQLLCTRLCGACGRPSKVNACKAPVLPTPPSPSLPLPSPFLSFRPRLFFPSPSSPTLSPARTSFLVFPSPSSCPPPSCLLSPFREGHCPPPVPHALIPLLLPVKDLSVPSAAAWLMRAVPCFHSRRYSSAQAGMHM